MGNCSLKEQLRDDNSAVAVNKGMFHFHCIIGRGGFSRVWKVEKKKECRVFAVKEMFKPRILTKQSVNSVLNEKRILRQLQNEYPYAPNANSFLVNMHYAFQDKENLYLVMDYMSGGDLRFQMLCRMRYTEAEAKFMVACVVQALEYIHNHGIIHRDVKPENLVFDSRGYVHLTDFGIARIWKPENAQDTSGTPEYMAPEVLSKSNYGVAVDYYALGVIVYELMMGRRPYLGSATREIKEQILARQAQIQRGELPAGWSWSAATFVNSLLRRKPGERLGVNGCREVKAHPWLRNFPWESLRERKLTAPFVPNEVYDNFDPRHVNERWNDDELAIKQNTYLLEDRTVQNFFSEYYYDESQETRPRGRSEASTTVGSKDDSAEMHQSPDAAAAA